jgi:serine-type D-Ala-D-Ala carboxypeptidase (penicillin-binding protein 5/6)
MVEPLLSLLLFGIVPLTSSQPSTAMQAPVVTVARPVTSVVSAGMSPLTLSGSLTAKSVVVMDLDSAQILFQQAEREVRPMASLTKLMTALVVAEEYDMSTWATVPSEVRTSTGSLLYLYPGQQYTIGDFLKGLLVQSGNDAAVSLAVIHSGSEASFVSTMNERAQSLGLTQTSFANPTGLDDPRQYSSAQDLAWLALHVLRHPELRERLNLPQAQMFSRDRRTINLNNTHQLIGEDATVVFGKTGTTDEAGQCLLTVVERGDRTSIVVLLGSEDRYADMRVLLEALKN